MSASRSKTTYGLKVKRLPGDIQKQELNSVFTRFGTIQSIHIHGGDEEAYAFINYNSHDEARMATEEMNGTKVNGKRMTVILQSPRRFKPYRTEKRQHISDTGWTPKLELETSTSSSSSRSKPALKPQSVSVFNRLGPSATGCTPNLELETSTSSSSSNFKPPTESVFDRLGPPVPNPPSDAQLKPSCIISAQLPCEPLTSRLLTSVYKEQVEKIASTQGVDIKRNEGEEGICLMGRDPEMVKLAKTHITTLKEDVEREIARKDRSLHCKYVPLLIQREAVAFVSLIEEKHGVEFLVAETSKEEERVTFTSFVQQVSEKVNTSLAFPSGGELLKVSDVSAFFNSKGTIQETPTWLFEDDQQQLTPFSNATSSEVEKMFQASNPTNLKFNGYEYQFSFTPGAMTQTNVSTRRERRIQRLAMNNPTQVEHHIRFYARGLQSHLETAMDELIQELDKGFTVICHDITPGSDRAFHETLLQSTSLYCVESRIVDSKIEVSGARDYIDGVELLLCKQLLAYKGPDLVPDHWEPQNSKIELKPIDRGSSEWTEVEDLMHATLPTAQIIELSRVQNRWVWDKYRLTKCQMSEKNGGIVNKRNLFHGTSRTLPEKIYNSKKGFDYRCASGSGVLGEGTYFAVNASYSARGYAHPFQKDISNHLPSRYAPSWQIGIPKQLILAYVLTGETYRCGPQGARGLKKPPPKPSGDGDYDSVSMNISGSDIFVTYELGQAYPAYLITFQ